MSNTLQPGDILIVNRGLYKHYGIYAGNGTVIHYASRNGDFGDDICIHEAPLEQFADEDEIIVGRFSETFLHTHTLHSPEETVRRARSRIGERKYNLITNNCEHFALWCKTGESESGQVNTAAAAIALAASIFDSLFETDDNGNLTELAQEEENELNKLPTMPVDHVDELTAEQVISFFKTEEILTLLRLRNYLKAVVMKYQDKVILCLYNMESETMEGNLKVIEPCRIAPDLQVLFGDKKMIVLQ